MLSDLGVFPLAGITLSGVEWLVKNKQFFFEA